MELKEVAGAGNGEGDGGGCHAGHQQGKEAAQCEVNHQHFQREDQTGNGSLEDAGDGAGSTAAHEEHHLLGVQMEQSAQVGADGRTRQHNRGLGTDTTAEANGDARCHDA